MKQINEYLNENVKGDLKDRIDESIQTAKLLDFVSKSAPMWAMAIFYCFGVMLGAYTFGAAVGGALIFGGVWYAIKALVDYFKNKSNQEAAISLQKDLEGNREFMEWYNRPPRNRKLDDLKNIVNNMCLEDPKFVDYREWIIGISEKNRWQKWFK